MDENVNLIDMKKIEWNLTLQFLSEQKRSAADSGSQLLRLVGQHALQQDHGGHDIYRQAV